MKLRIRNAALPLALLLVLQPLLIHVPDAFASGGLVKGPSMMTKDQRVAHVLSRLTFGGRPGDFERVKAMGVEAFIAQQLDPDSLNNSEVIKRLRRLPTLGMATPVIIEQYTPPKPRASPSPAPTSDKSAASGRCSTRLAAWVSLCSVESHLTGMAIEPVNGFPVERWW